MERRKHIRSALDGGFPLLLELGGVQPGRRIATRLLDLSEGGCRFVLPAEPYLEIGALLELHFASDAFPALCLNARIARRTDADCACCFERNGPRELAVLRDVLHAMQTMRFTRQIPGS